MSKDDFLLGVIEGFYGKPWTFEQRKRLFAREKEFDFKYFMYAPKDETKHRRLWRELHDEIELLYLKELITSASSQDVAFIYAISPGLDMVYSSEQELHLLETKLRQIYDLGCRHFALLFDDIDTYFHCSLDHKHFSSLAKAQTHVSNSIYNTFSTDCHFMFCPTEYCTSRAFPSLDESEYLRTVGNDLCQAFHVLWTGDKVVSEEITVQQIKPLRKILKRKPLIWENLHANDYDPRRVFLGPYDGRDPQIIQEISGVLSNPNNQFELNYIPLLSLSHWYNNAVEKLEFDCEKVCRKCAEQWVAEVSRQLPCEERIVAQITVANNPTPEESGGTNNGGSEMDFEIDSSYSISVEEIELILSFNYLPFKAGPAADKLFEEAKCLVESISCKNDDWAERVHKLILSAGKVIVAIDNLLDCPNRQIAFEIYPMLSETRVIMDMLTRHFKWLLGESCPVSEEKRVGFYTRFGINGQFNSLLTNIMEPNSWFGGVMILPLATKFTAKAASFMCSVSDFRDCELLESLLISAIEQSPVLCYVMMNSQDDILAISIGYEKPDSLSKFLKTYSENKKALIESDLTPNVDGVEDTEMKNDAIEDANNVKDVSEADNNLVAGNNAMARSLDSDYLMCLSSLLESREDSSPGSGDGAENTVDKGLVTNVGVSLDSVCSVVVFTSPRMVPKMFENFLMCINTAVKTLPSISASRFIFERDFLLSSNHLVNSMASLDYSEGKEQQPNSKFITFTCKRPFVDQEMRDNIE